MKEHTTVLGVPFDTLTLQEAVDAAMEMMADGGRHMVCTPNPEIVMDAQKDKELMGILRGADLVLPDGIGVVWASKYTKNPIRERVAGYDFVQALLKRMQNTDLTVYFFGGAPGVAAAAARRMQREYPGLKIVGVHNGYFDAREEQHIIKEIRSLKPDLLLVGLGAPKQEKWIYENQRVAALRLCVGVGGSFDVMSGNTKRAPRLYQKLGLEWLYRLLSQPKRLFRMAKLPRFVMAVYHNRAH